jgi:lysophospholipase L1-like esterase
MSYLHAVVTLFSLLSLLAAAGPARAATPIDPAQARQQEGSQTLWYDLQLLDVEGQGWSGTAAPFDRLPAKAEELVRKPVWGLSRNSAGLCVRFVTDSPVIHARWTLTQKNLALPHMAATGVSGLDLYAENEPGKWRWLACARPTTQTNTVQLVTGIPDGKRHYLLYLPLYNGVSSVELGIPAGKTLAKADARMAGRQKPIIFYGTSITQGGCASRPGMVHTAILGRRLNYPVINLGFSGNGKMEPELADLLAELDPAVYVLDCLPNMSPQETAERVEPFVKTLRKAHPETPIVLVEDRFYTDGFLLDSRHQRNVANHAALKQAYQNLTSADVKHLHYLSADGMLGDDGEGTVDGSHPTDLGFMRQADAFEKVLRPLLTGK